MLNNGIIEKIASFEDDSFRYKDGLHDDKGIGWDNAVVLFREWIVYYHQIYYRNYPQVKEEDLSYAILSKTYVCPYDDKIVFYIVYSPKG